MLLLQLFRRIACSRWSVSDPELRETFDAAIQSMKDDGTLNELIVEYLGADSPKF